MNPISHHQLAGKKGPRTMLQANLLILMTASCVAAMCSTAALAQDQSAQRAAPRRAQATQSISVTPTFDRAAFETSLHGQLKDKGMGYAFVLMRDGQMVSEGAGGAARDNQDGFLPMKTSTPVNIGSLFKFVAGVSMLHAMEQPPVGAGFSGNDTDAKLNTPVSLVLPAFWKNGMSPRAAKLTFRDYMQHRTGFTTDNMLNEFRKPARPGPPRAIAFNYENLNFRVLGFALGAFANPTWLSQINQDSARTTSNENDMIYTQRALGSFMDDYIRNTVMKKVPGGAVPSCDAAGEFKATGAYAYKSKSDTGPGIITSRKADGSGCVGSGGYWMSARHLAAFASAALNGTKLLSAKAQNLMYGAGNNPANRIIWTSARPRDWTNEHFGEPYVVWSGGRQEYAAPGNQRSGGALLRLPDKYVLVMLHNSEELDSASLEGQGYAAFLAGKTPYVD